MRRAKSILPIKDEHAEQVAVCDYLTKFYPRVMYWSNPNGAHLSGNAGQRAAQMNKLKAEGFLPGVSYLTIFEPRGKFSALFIEMKRADGGGGASENQLEFIREVGKRGAYGIVCNGFDEAKKMIDWYLALK